MRAHGMTASELAEQMNQALLMKTGRMGELTDRTIRRFLSGQTRWPQSRQRLALQHVFGSTAEQLGFLSPTAPHHSEDPVQRRTFLSRSAALAASPVIPAPSGSRVGRSDVAALQVALNDLVASYSLLGSDHSLEVTALQHGQRAIDLVQNCSASSKVRQLAYALASDAVNTAGWSAMETGAYDRAQQYLERSLALAGLAADSTTVMGAWNGLALLAQRRSHFSDAAAAAEAACNTGVARRDPLFASLAHARAAIAHSAASDRRKALRSIDHAEKGLERSKENEERPVWIHFYDKAELNGLAALMSLQLGRHADAEYHAHRALARLKPELQRNRAYYTALLGLSQIRQDELEQGCATLNPLFAGSLPRSERINDMLRDFRRHAADTGSAIARRWLSDTAEAI